MTTARPQQRYDHRLRELVHRTGDLTIATDLGVPPSTARAWLGTAPTVVFSLEVADLTELELRRTDRYAQKFIYACAVDSTRSRKNENAKKGSGDTATSEPSNKLPMDIPLAPMHPSRTHFCYTANDRVRTNGDHRRDTQNLDEQRH